MDVIVVRPWALIFLLPAVVFCFFKLKSVQAWLGIVDAHLLNPLLVKTYMQLKERLNALFLIACVCSLLCALVGFSLKIGETSLYHPKSPSVIVLDLSLSMKVKDVSPNRFSRAIFKVYDLLDELKGIPTALIVFTDEPYLLIPATADKEVVETILPLLTFNLMPSQGSRLDRALEEALQTIKETGADFGDIFLITDGGDDILEVQDKTELLLKTAAQNGNRLFVLGVGTVQGGELFEKEGVPFLDALGNPVKHRLKEDTLKRLAQLGGGKYVRVETDNSSDVSELIKARENILIAGEKSVLTDKEASDKGYWFLILPLIGFPFLFQKGRLFVAFFVFFAPFSVKASPLDYFLSPSGLAMKRFEQGKQEEAVQIAIKSNRFNTLYNVGTRLIFAGNYAQAEKLLELAVAINSQDENALINLEIARRLNEQKNSPPSSESNKDGPTGGQSGQGGEGEGQSGQSGEGEGQSGQSGAGDGQSGQGGEGEGQSGQSGEGDGQSGQGGEGEGQSGQGGEGEGQSGQSGEGDGQSGQGGAGDGQSGQSGEGDGQSGQGGEGLSDESGNAEKKNKNEIPKMIPVHEDPLTLLRYKILFLHQESRYKQEKKIGAQW